MIKNTSTPIWLILLFCLQINAQEPKLKKAFNGKNLKGWVIPDGNKWWSADKGILLGKSDADKKGSILWTEKEFENFIVELDFLFGEGTVDSGIFLRTEGHQIQIGISGSLKRDMTGSPYISGIGYPVEAENMAEILKQDQWNTIKVKVIGKVYKVWMNGVEVVKYEAEKLIDNGPIGLQVHANRDMQISFRNIKVAELK